MILAFFVSGIANDMIVYATLLSSFDIVELKMASLIGQLIKLVGALIGTSILLYMFWTFTLLQEYCETDLSRVLSTQISLNPKCENVLHEQNFDGRVETSVD